MTCISLVFWWYLATLGPNPTLLARFPTEQACWESQNVWKSAVSLTERPR